MERMRDKCIHFLANWERDEDVKNILHHAIFQKIISECLNFKVVREKF